ncbi:MAG: endonuclease/exonuclease/phosphatase family protein [Planctomycetota bacterium]
MNKDLDAEISPSIISKISWWLVCLISSLILILGIAPLLSRFFFICELLNNFRLQIGILGLISTILLFYSRAKLFSLVQLVVACCVLVPIIVGVFPKQQPAEGNNRFTLMSYNIWGGNSKRDEVIEMLQTAGPDVLVVLEYVDHWIEPLNQLHTSYTYRIEEPRWHGFGIAMYSRYPIEYQKIHSITEKSTDNPLIVVQINIKGQSFLVCGAHLLAPMTPARMDIRNQQFIEAAEIIDKIQTEKNLPMIFVGDLNCVAWSPYAKELMQRCQLRDSRQGYLYQGTWPSANPFLNIPIDNAFISDEICVHNRIVLPTIGSDHFPIWLELSFREDN